MTTLKSGTQALMAGIGPVTILGWACRTLSGNGDWYTVRVEKDGYEVYARWDELSVPAAARRADPGPG